MGQHTPQIPSNESLVPLQRQPTVILVRHPQQPIEPSFLDLPLQVSNPESYAVRTLSGETIQGSPNPQFNANSTGHQTRPASRRTTTYSPWCSDGMQVGRITQFPPPDLNGLNDPGSLPELEHYSQHESPDRLILPSKHANSRQEKRPPLTVHNQTGRSVATSQMKYTAQMAKSVSRHHGLIPFIETTDKFTHKWPKPQLLRSSTSTARTGLGLEASLALEEGQGLGFVSMAKWTTFKWTLLISITTVFAYGTAAMVCATMTWFRTWDKADVMSVADGDILILITLTASILLFTALVGMTGTHLNSRPILSIYNLLLWPALVSMLAVGYLSYKRVTFSLDHKLNLSWSQYYTPLGRVQIQDSLHCCGFYSALHEATPSKRCYPRTSLPGCKGKLFRFERDNLNLIWTVVFSLVPLHLINITVALVCANHISRTFGKGITPKRYRLSSMDVKMDAERILRGMATQGVKGVRRPGYSRASTSGILREDREERLTLLHHPR